jgi:hypothetical protein
MKSSRPFFLPFAFALAAALPLHAAEPLYKNDFESTAVDKPPAEVMIMAGTFEVKADGANKVLELPGEPLDSFGMLFGPSSKGEVSASARFHGTKKGRKFPTFGISLNGVGGYRLQVSPAKNMLEFIKADEPRLAVPFTWASDTWTSLRITVSKKGEGWLIEGKAWPAGAPEPEKPTISLEEKTEPTAGRAGIWGSPYAGTPIRFDDLLIVPAR